MTNVKPRVIAFINSCSQYKSGGDVVFIEIAKRLKGYRKIIITPLIGKRLCQSCGLKGRYLVTTKESGFGNVIITYTRRILKALSLNLKTRKSDTLLGTSDFLTDVLPIFWFKMRNKKAKWVQHIFHLIPFPRKIPFFAQRLSLSLIRRFADLIVVDNSLLKKDLIKLGFGSQKIVVNYPGIDLKYLKSVKANKEKSYDAVFMAQLRSSKGVLDLIKIWELACEKNSGFRLGIIGRGEKEIIRTLKTMIKARGLEKNIDLLGYLTDDEAFAIIRSSRIFVTPSREEGFGIVMLETQALGLPVVAWHLPVFDEVFKSGMIKVKAYDIEKFAKEVVSLLTSKSLYQKLSGEAIENADRYDWDKTTYREENFFSDLHNR